MPSPEAVWPGLYIPHTDMCMCVYVLLFCSWIERRIIVTRSEHSERELSPI